MAILSGQRKYIGSLAAAAIAILVVGSVFRPEKKEERSAPVSETELARLSQLAQRNNLYELNNYLQGVADSEARHLVRLGDSQTGVVWKTAGKVVTAAAPGSGELIQMRDAATEGSSPVPGRVRTPSSDAWVLAVTKGAAGRTMFAQGLFLGIMPGTCGGREYLAVHSSVPLSLLFAGGGLFDLDGNLLALIARCENQPIAIAATSIDLMLRSALPPSAEPGAALGLTLTALGEDERQFSGATRGVFVKAVEKKGLGYESGLRPGDVVLAVDRETITDAADVEKALAGVAGDHRLQVWRDGRTRVLRWEDAARAAQPAAGLILPEPERGVRIERVLPGSAAAKAGLKPGDRLVQVEHREANATADLNALWAAQAKRPLFLAVEQKSWIRGHFLHHE